MFRQLIFEKSGITLHDGKKELVRTRLGSRVRSLGFGSYKDYFHHVENDSSENELVTLLDAISTNLTSFFREINHFQLLEKMILPEMLARKKKEGKSVRFWSAGCSSGEEPYSIAYTLIDLINDYKSYDLKILATDISTQMLQRGARGVYGKAAVKTVPVSMLRRFMEKEGDREAELYVVKNEVKKLISFRRFNLMTNTFPFKRKFDVIFCRNVMIYFDKPTQQTLVNKYYDVLANGGYLLIGHSESLTGVDHKFKYIQPTVYKKPL